MKRTIQIEALALGTFIAGATLGRAQATGFVPVQTPTVLSGNDIGFRVEGTQGDTLVGTLVVRVNGQWVETQYK